MNFKKVHRVLASAAALCMLATVVHAQNKIQTPPPARTVVNSAIERATSENKNIMVHFEASWCSWCKHLDDALRSPELGKLFADNYVLVAITVLERDDMKAAENPGSDVLMKEWGGEKAGLPFYTFLDKKGAPIANSLALPKAGNIGYPATEEEIKAFGGLLERTAPRMTSTQRAAVIDYLKKHAPKAEGQ